MSLKSIKSNYTKFLGVLQESGVRINESQKETLDNFMLAIESKIEKTRDDAIRATKRIVEDRKDRQYKTLFESIQKNTREMNELAGKVQQKIGSINESKKIAEAVDAFLDKYVEEILPKKALVDYQRMEKLERIHESLKDMLQVNDMALENRKVELNGRLVRESEDLRTKCQGFEKRISEDCEKMKELEKKLEEAETREFVHNKVKDLPIAEAEMVQKKVSGMSKKDLEDNFQKILEGVRDEIRDEIEEEQEEKNLEEAISDILEEKERQKKAENSISGNEDAEGRDVETAEDDGQEYEEDEDEESEVQVVNESVMRSWIDTLNRITP